MLIEQRAKEILEKIKKEDKKINSFLELNPNLMEEARILDKKKTRGKLYGKFIGVKSNINVMSLTASCASKTLENYKSTFDATVIEKIKAEDGLILGMLNCDEFACGWTGETSAFGPVENPVVNGHVTGGSSSGSAAAVAAGFCDVSLGSDTGGSIRVPASFCGVVGVKPSYGAVSRYGLIDLSMSIDQIGPIAKNVEDAELVLDVIFGKDEKDTKSENYSREFKLPKKFKIGFLNVAGVDKEIKNLFDEKVSELKKNFEVFEIDLKYLDLAVQTYHLLVWTEFFSATRRFDGRKYGKKIEDSAGEEVLRRILGGSEVAKAENTGRYYHKALEVKELIKQEFEKAFEKCDCIISPTTPVSAPKLGAKLSFDELKLIDILTIPANLAEVCAISIPFGSIKEKEILKPIGLQIMCTRGEDFKMMKIARVLA